LWIFPKTLIFYRSAQATGALISDSDALSRLFARSVLWRSKPSPSRTWCRRLRTDSSSLILSSRTSSPSTGACFVEEWMSSRGASLVSRSRKLEPEEPTTTPDTSSPSSERGSLSSDLPLFSLRTSRGSSPRSSRETDGETPRGLQFSSMSSESWSAWTTAQRLECSRRRKSGRHIVGTESSSSLWIMTSPNDRELSLIISFETASSDQSEVDPSIQPPETSPPIAGSRAESLWATPTTRDHKGAYSEASQEAKPRNLLPDQVRAQGRLWTTVSVRDHYDANLKGPIAKRADGKERLDQLPRQVLHQEDYRGPINPRWIEALMGIPIGWTSPSCSTPLIIESTRSDSSGTGSSQRQPSEPSESFGGGSESEVPTPLKDY
jgi:hypothetical protein